MVVRRPKVQLHPINWVQRIALYETPARFYLVGSNNTQTAFKVLKIDRTVNELSLLDDRVEYTYQEIRDLITRLNRGNITKTNARGVTKTESSFGLLGFVRFLNGYYLILIVKRRKVASIGYHTIYKVEDTKLVYIPNEAKQYVNEESRYERAFHSVGLSSNFYFSYSYDITRSLQYNLSPVRGTKFFQKPEATNAPPKRDEETEHSDMPARQTDNNDEDSSADKTKESTLAIFVKTKPSQRFVWNSHLIDFDGLHDDWKIYLMHGFVAQANICVYGKPIFVTLVARRSRRYCGTRFLKRGLNMSGDVANEVETEQIVHDGSISDFSQGFYTSFVQLRGSVPDRWSQDVTKLVAKPQIVQNFSDPYHVATARHFNDLLGRYGSPIVALSLVKKKEKQPHESILNGMLSASVNYLNQFLPEQHVIRLMAFDMARSNKSRSKDVMQRLEKIGFNIIRVTGIFQGWRSSRVTKHDRKYTLHLRQRTFTRQPSSSRIAGYRLRTGQSLQNGIVRVNCVDCLDRTNTAQFVLGKVALAFQLQALGVLIEPHLDYDTDAIRLLEQLYEDHGDTIALQYGGSQLVHRVKTYRKVAPITSHSSEIMQTLSRYYSNTFSDAEKQNVINLFLGVRMALPTNAQSILNKSAICDYYLHNQQLLVPFQIDYHRFSSYSQWWDKRFTQSLPRAYEEYEKESISYALELRRADAATMQERMDYYFDAYRPFEVSYLNNLFSVQILNTIRDYMPSGSTNYDPFCLRLEPGKLKVAYLRMQDSRKLPPNPSVYGLPSNSSSDSELSLMESNASTRSSDDEDDELNDPVSVTRNSMPDVMEQTVVASSSILSSPEQRFSINGMHQSTLSNQTYDYSMRRYLSEETQSVESATIAIGRDQVLSIGQFGMTEADPADLKLYREYLDIERGLAVKHGHSTLRTDELLTSWRTIGNVSAMQDG